MSDILVNSKTGLVNMSQTMDWKSNTGTLVLEWVVHTSDTFSFQDGDDVYTMEIDIGTEDETYYLSSVSKIGDILTYPQIPADYYPNLPWRCVSKNISMMQENNERSWKIICTYEAEGLQYYRANTETVRLVAVSYSPENYEFSVREAFKNTDYGDDVDDDQSTPTKLIANNNYDPLLEGLTQTRCLGVLKFTLEYASSEDFNPEEIDTEYNNTINNEPVVVLNRYIDKYRGWLSVDAMDTYIPSTDEIYYRVSYSIKIKASKDTSDSWINKVLNQGYRQWDFNLEGKVDILKGDVTPGLYTSADPKKKEEADEPVTEPQLLDDLGLLLDPAEEDPFWLYFQVQPKQDWSQLMFPSSSYG